MPPVTYTNPLIATDFPDPSLLVTPDQGFFAYATHDEFSPTEPNILVSRSTDLMHWSKPVGALQQPPVWAPDSIRYWCPQVVCVDGQYRLYYAAEKDKAMHLALAVSDKPYDFLDIGKPISDRGKISYAMIDPCFFADPKTGKHYLYYGSAEEPIRVVELAKDGYTFLTEPVPVLYPLPGVKFETLREGAFLTYAPTHERYFLWVSGDNTWEPDGYAVSVFWAADPLGDFVPIPDSHIVLRSNGHWDSPGQCEVFTDAAGADWMVYHAVDKQSRFIEGRDVFQRQMCMDRVHYTADGWPYLAGHSPSFTPQPAPTVHLEKPVSS